MLECKRYQMLILEKGSRMMKHVSESRNMYEDFVVETDILFFKTGSHGLVSFHGRNYNIKRE